MLTLQDLDASSLAGKCGIVAIWISNNATRHTLAKRISLVQQKPSLLVIANAIKCDEECLRLQRNALLANALNIDPQAHTDDHVPYSDATLKFFKENTQFAQTYEREYRVFAGDPTKKLLRLKPMRSHQRAFLHSLAEDFGFDSESVDPEPHRHVCLFKTPRFVSAPMKTLAQCAKIKAAAAQNSLAQPAVFDSKNTVEKPYNALLLSTPRFGLTAEELESAFQREYTAYPSIKFHTSFLPSDEVVIKGSGAWTPQILESSLSSLKPILLQEVRRLDLASDVSLCNVDDSLNVLRREQDVRGKGEGGWSSVVGRSASRPKLAASAVAPPTSLRRNFVALKKEPKKKAEEQPVEEDWELAAEKLDEEGISASKS
ncbi:FKBP12-associated protein [Parahypoxylon ruwenzoriense]